MLDGIIVCLLDRCNKIFEHTWATMSWYVCDVCSMAQGGTRTVSGRFRPSTLRRVHRMRSCLLWMLH